MTLSEVARRRLSTQHIGKTKSAKPGEAVAWLGAVQAQDYLGALWALGLRTRNATEEDIEKAIAAKIIIRTWPLRGTLHFVAASDARWMTDLSAPRIIAASTRRNQLLGLDDATFARSRELFVGALRGGKQLSRGELYRLLETARISTANGRGLQIVWRLAHEGIICFGARKAKQQTFALLDEWAPEAKPKEREEAMAELARRYFTSHGPATLQDFAWWSGLTAADARDALETAKPHLVQETVEGRAYWLAPSMRAVKEVSSSAYLLPAFDEYTVAYTDRTAVLDPKFAKRPNMASTILGPVMVVNGQVAGTWKRTFENGSVIVKLAPFSPLIKAAKNALADAARRYGEFLGLPVMVASMTERAHVGEASFARSGPHKGLEAD